MGVYECNKCGEVMCGESFSCQQCHFGEGDGNILCDGCANAGCCDKCDESMCIYCVEGSKGNFQCCGMELCGAKEDTACAERHVTKTLDCGHEGCNFHEGGCLPCETEKEAKAEKDAVTGDIGVIKSIMDKIKSKSVKAALESIVEDPAGKKRKRDKERVEKLEFSLKMARNALSGAV
ncbi:hypothetical protein ACHAXR_009588 [Thalassiosira sp. AJA248-18]